MSSIALRTFDLPDALAPNTPAAGSMPIGRPPSRHVTDLTISSSASLVEISDNSNSSRNDRTFWARKVSNAETPSMGFGEFTDLLSQKTCVK